MRRPRGSVLVAVAVLDALLLGAALGRLVTQDGNEPGAGPAAAPATADRQGAGAAPSAEGGIPTAGLPARRSADKGKVAARPWPARVAAPGPWSASLAGRGDRVTLTTEGMIVDGIGRATLDLGSADPRPASSRGEPLASNRVLVLPDGAQWYPLGPVKLEGGGDLAFSSAAAKGPSVTATAPSLEAVLGSARGITGVGTFVQPQGAQVARLGLPAGTRLVELCRREPGAGLTPCPDRTSPPLQVEVTVASGQSMRASGDGEVAVAGGVRVSALGRSWEAMVGAVEAQRLRASATYDVDRWAVTAEGDGARQVWVDVWPVVDTKLTARSVLRIPGVLDSFSLRIQWTNVGFATSQIFEAEGVGPGASTVGFDLNKTVGHDAGLGVTRGDRVLNLRGGGDIDSNLAPGENVDRGLSATAGSAVTVVLRGNFPEVRVPLAVPPA